MSTEEVVGLPADGPGKRVRNVAVEVTVGTTTSQTVLQQVVVLATPDGALISSTTPVPVAGSVSIQQGVSVSAQVSGTVTVNTAATVAGASVTIQQGASVSAQVSGTVTVGTQLGTAVVSVVPGVSVSLGSLATVVGTTTATSGVTGPIVWLGASQSVLVTVQTQLGTQVVSVVPGVSVTLPTVATILTIVTQLGTQVVSVVPGVSVTLPTLATVLTVVTILGTQVVSVVPGVSVSAQVSGTVTAIPADRTTAVPSISATGQIIWVGGGQSTTAFPVVITGTVTAGAGTTVVSLTGSALVSGTVTVGTQLGTAVVSVVPGVSVSLGSLATVVGTTTATSGVTGAIVWLGASQSVLVTVQTQLGTQVVSVVPGVSVTLPTVATILTVVTILGTQIVSVVPGVSVQASGTVTAIPADRTTAVPSISATGGILWIAGGQSTTAFPVVVTGTVAVGGVSGTLTAIPVDRTTATPAAAASGGIVWVANPGAAVATTVLTVQTILTTVTVTGTVIISAGTTVVSGTVTVGTQLGTAVVSVVPGVSVSLGSIETIKASIGPFVDIAHTGLVVMPRAVAAQAIQIVVTSTAIAQSVNKYVFTIWTGATGAPAAAGTTSWAVPSGKLLRLNNLYAAVTSSAVVGDSIIFMVGVGATASMISASISTQLQMLKLQLFAGAALVSGGVVGYSADVTAGESIAILIAASSAAVLVGQMIVSGNLF